MATTSSIHVSSHQIWNFYKVSRRTWSVPDRSSGCSQSGRQRAHDRCLSRFWYWNFLDRNCIRHPYTDKRAVPTRWTKCHCVDAWVHVWHRCHDTVACSHAQIPTRRGWNKDWTRLPCGCDWLRIRSQLSRTRFSSRGQQSCYYWVWDWTQPFAWMDCWIGFRGHCRCYAEMSNCSDRACCSRS